VTSPATAVPLLISRCGARFATDATVASTTQRRPEMHSNALSSSRARPQFLGALRTG